MNQIDNKNEITRTVYFDYLRVFATLAVMFLHISANNWRNADVNGLAWQTFNFVDSIVRWGVPVFVMISGSLFLNRDIPLKKIYSKYILRLAVSFAVWSIIYALFVDGSILNKISAMLQGHYHMWFILMIICIYACLPFIKPIINSDKRGKYFLLLSFIFAFFIPELLMLLNDSGKDMFIKLAAIINNDVNNMEMHMVLGYVSYFILGYYLNKIELNKKQRTVIYLLGLAGFAFTIIVDSLFALKLQTCFGKYYNNFTVNVMFEAIAVFTFFKYKDYNNKRVNDFVKVLSKYSFGAYLVHALIIEQLDVRFGLNTLSFNPILAELTIGIIVFLVSFVISGILNKIPVLNKYIV